MTIAGIGPPVFKKEVTFLVSLTGAAKAIQPPGSNISPLAAALAWVNLSHLNLLIGPFRHLAEAQIRLARDVPMEKVLAEAARCNLVVEPATGVVLLSGQPLPPWVLKHRTILAIAPRFARTIFDGSTAS